MGVRCGVCYRWGETGQPGRGLESGVFWGLGLRYLQFAGELFGLGLSFLA